MGMVTQAPLKDRMEMIEAPGSTRTAKRPSAEARAPRGLRSAIWIMVGTICACAHTEPGPRAPRAQPPLAQPPLAASRVLPQPPLAASRALGLFAPRPANSERKAKLREAANQLDALYGARWAQAGASSAVVGIVMDGELVYQGAFGAIDTTSNTRPDSETSFRIGSLSKSFAATAILKLRDEGKLALDDPAVRYVGELSKLRGIAPGSPPITIRHLLTMTSGLAYDDTWGPVSFGYDHRELSHFFDDGVTLASQPGERYAYSNLGYAILGLVVERVSKLSFRDYVSRNVFVPLGMSSTGWAPAPQRMAVGYYRRKGELVPEPHPDDGVFAPAGGIYSTLGDYSRYLAFQLAAYADPAAPEAAPLLRATVREMHRGHAWMRWGPDAPVAGYEADRGLRLMASSYGFGWVNNTTCDYEGIVQHGGYEPGYYAYVRLLPRHGLGVIVLSATAAIGDYETFRGALNVLKERGLLATVEPLTPMLREAQQRVNRLLSRWDDDLGRATFDPGSLQYSWFSTIGQDLQKLALAHGECAPDGELVASSATQASWRMRCTRGAVDFSVWLNPATRPHVQLLTWKEYPPAGTKPDAPFTVPPQLPPNAPCQAH
jgi:CubicO group peptidase (beta-lactamase class C family)